MPRDAVSRTANVGTWLRKRNGYTHMKPTRPLPSHRVYREIDFPFLFNYKLNLIVFTLLRLIWNKIEFCLYRNQSENFKYKPISINFT